MQCTLDRISQWACSAVSEFIASAHDQYFRQPTITWTGSHMTPGVYTVCWVCLSHDTVLLWYTVHSLCFTPGMPLLSAGPLCWDTAVLSGVFPDQRGHCSLQTAQEPWEPWRSCKGMSSGCTKLYVFISYVLAMATHMHGNALHAHQVTCSLALAHLFQSYTRTEIGLHW